MTGRRRPHVLIIGGGFAGLHAARALRRTQARVTVLDRSTSHVFQPLLYQCATGLISEGAISSPLRHLLRHQRNAHATLGEAVDIDVTEQTVTARRIDGSTYDLPYDYLVVAAGMRQSYAHHEEFEQFAPGMKTLDDALTIRRSVITAFEMAESLPDPEQRRPWLTFAVAGGGPTGVELAGQIRELATHALRHEFRSIDPTEARVLLLHSRERVLPSFATSLSRSAQRTLDAVGVETHLGVHVTDVTATSIETTTKAEPKTHTRYDTHTVVWTAGVEAVPFLTTLAKALGVEQDRSGRIAVTPDLTVPSHAHVFVVGDVMALDDLPGVAEVAMQSGRHAGARIAAGMRGELDPGAFRYRDLGSAAYIARGHAVVQSGPLHLSGRLGWLAWGAIHVAFLAGIRNRLGTVTTWGATLLTGSRRERAITFGSPTTARDFYS